MEIGANEFGSIDRSDNIKGEDIGTLGALTGVYKTRLSTLRARSVTQVEKG